MSRTHCGSGYLEGIQKNRTTASIAAASAMMTIVLRTLLRSLCAIYAFRADAEKKGVLLGRNATQYRDCFAGMPDILSNATDYTPLPLFGRRQRSHIPCTSRRKWHTSPNGLSWLMSRSWKCVTVPQRWQVKWQWLSCSRAETV